MNLREKYIPTVRRFMFDLAVDLCVEKTGFEMLHNLAANSSSIKKCNPVLLKPVSILKSSAELISVCNTVVDEQGMQTLFETLDCIYMWTLSDQFYAKLLLDKVHTDLTQLALSRLDENKSQNSHIQAGIDIIKALAQVPLDPL